MHGFLAEVEAETTIESGSYGKEPFQFLECGGFAVFVGKDDLEVANHPWDHAGMIEQLSVGKRFHDLGPHRLVPRLVFVDTA